MKGYRVLEVLQTSPTDIERVDCGTCPVTVACAVERGGNGYTFNCCGATGVIVEDDVVGGSILLMMDCAIHKFEKNEEVNSMPHCPLCSGAAVRIQMAQIGTTAKWVPTIHSKVPVEARLRKFRAAADTVKQWDAEATRRKSLG